MSEITPETNLTDVPKDDLYVRLLDKGIVRLTPRQQRQLVEHVPDFIWYVAEWLRGAGEYDKTAPELREAGLDTRACRAGLVWVPSYKGDIAPSFQFLRERTGMLLDPAVMAINLAVFGVTLGDPAASLRALLWWIMPNQRLDGATPQDALCAPDGVGIDLLLQIGQADLAAS